MSVYVFDCSSDQIVVLVIILQGPVIFWVIEYSTWADIQELLSLACRSVGSWLKWGLLNWCWKNIKIIKQLNFYL